MLLRYISKIGLMKIIVILSILITGIFHYKIFQYFQSTSFSIHGVDVHVDNNKYLFVLSQNNSKDSYNLYGVIPIPFLNKAYPFISFRNNSGGIIVVRKNTEITKKEINAAKKVSEICKVDAFYKILECKDLATEPIIFDNVGYFKNKFFFTYKEQDTVIINFPENHISMTLEGNNIDLKGIEIEL